METKLTIIKTLFNSIVSRINQLEQLNLQAKQFYETILNAQDQLKAIQDGVNLEEFWQQIDNDTFLHLELEIKISYLKIHRNNVEYADLVNKIGETIKNLHVIENQLVDQKKISGKLGQFILMLNELQAIFVIIEMNYNKNIKNKVHQEIRQLKIKMLDMHFLILSTKQKQKTELILLYNYNYFEITIQIQMDKQINELKEALEYQVDVVLRLEEERLLLLKENQIQKEKLKETNSILQKYLGSQLLAIDKAAQTIQIDVIENQCQTENPDDDLSDYSLSNSTVTQLQQSSVVLTQQSPLDEAKTLLKSSRMPIKKLKFCGDGYKENKQEQKQEIKPEKKAEKQSEALTKEIISLTKQLQQFKLQSRNQQDTLKKYEKETSELVKHLEVKNEMLQKLRNENAELSLIINQDKFKSIRTLDTELKQEREQKQKLQQSLAQKNQENAQLNSDLKQFREVLGKLTDEFERYREQQSSVKKQPTDIEQSKNIQLLNQELKIRQQTIDELKDVNDQLNQEIEYFKQISCKQKEINRKQDEDLDFYRELLVKHKIL